MKPASITTDRIIRIAAAGVALGAVILLAHAGPLNPPAGPVASTHKTLSQIEPRTAVQSLAGDADSQFRISQPGSYYLTANITGLAARRAIEIAADNVVLDLCGFSLAGVTGSLEGIGIPAAQTNIVIRNGNIRSFSGGVIALNATNSRLENVRAFANSGTGLYVGDGGILVACSADGSGASGMAGQRNCVFTECTAAGNTGAGFFSSGGSTFDACTANANTLAGFITDNSGPDVDTCTFRACTARSNTQEGFRVGNHATLVGCTAANNGFDGFIGTGGTSMQCCAASNNGRIGFNTPGGVIRGSASFSNDTEGMVGLEVTACAAYQNATFGISGPSILACSARGNGATQITGASGAVVVACVATAGPGDGIFIQGGSITNCLVAAQGGTGIRLSTEGAATGCLAAANSFDGIRVGDRCAIQNCLLVGNSTFGIQALSDNNRIENNHIILGANGLSVTSPAVRNLLVANSVNGLAAYSINAGNTVANRTGSPVAAADWTNFEW